MITECKNSLAVGWHQWQDPLGRDTMLFKHTILGWMLQYGVDYTDGKLELDGWVHCKHVPALDLVPGFPVYAI